MMEINLSKQAVSVNEVIYEGVTEQPLECDVLLPDYCPDIQKILRCEVTPSLLSAAVNGDRASIGGVAMAHVYYLDEAGCLRHVEYKIPYNKVIELRTAPQSPVITVNQTVDYFNCRAVSPRRLDMRGAVSISARVTGQAEDQVICDASGLGMQLRLEQAENTRILPQAVRPFTLREDVEIGYGKPAMGNIIRTVATADTTDYKVISGRIVAKGELNVKVVYQNEDDAQMLENIECALPLSQIIDIDGVDEDCICQVWFDVGAVDVIPRRTDDGTTRAFALDANVNACAIANRRVSLEAASDCYSTTHECKPTQKQVAFMQLVDVIRECAMFKETMELPNEVRSIADVWCNIGSTSIKAENDCVIVSGKVMVCVLACLSDGTSTYFDAPFEFSHRIALSGSYENIQFNPMIRAGAATYSITGDRLEVRCTVKIEGCLYNQYRKKVISEIAIDESRPKSVRENMLYLYYAQAQESIWEIAKRYNTSVSAIQASNGLETPVISEKQMLLIPMQ